MTGCQGQQASSDLCRCLHAAGVADASVPKQPWLASSFTHLCASDGGLVPSLLWSL